MNYGARTTSLKMYRNVGKLLPIYAV